jgi:iron complex outermembrane receptor protein
VVADGQYQHALLSGVDGMLGASLTIHSTSSTTFNTASAPAPDFKLPAYSLLDLRAGLLSQDGRWRLSLFAHNVTNKYYWMSVGQVTDLRTRLAGMPLTYGINLGWRWR